MQRLNAPITEFLLQWNNGDPEAMNRVVQHTYSQLRNMAEAHFKKHRPGETMQPTALVHEAYLRLLSSRFSLKNRHQYFWFIGKLMRHILTDHVRAKLTEKRGGNLRDGNCNLDTVLPCVSAPLSAGQLLDLDLALDRLAAFDSRQSYIMEMYFFCDFKIDDIAANLSISPATVKREMRVAKAWLANQIPRA